MFQGFRSCFVLRKRNGASYHAPISLRAMPLGIPWLFVCCLELDLAGSSAHVSAVWLPTPAYGITAKVFWHLEENPKMKDQKFYRGDVVSFEMFEDTSRGERNDKARAKDMCLDGTRACLVKIMESNIYIDQSKAIILDS